jgi:hypothetical protein
MSEMARSRDFIGNGDERHGSIRGRRIPARHDPGLRKAEVLWRPGNSVDRNGMAPPEASLGTP